PDLHVSISPSFTATRLRRRKTIPTNMSILRADERDPPTINDLLSAAVTQVQPSGVFKNRSQLITRNILRTRHAVHSAAMMQILRRVLATRAVIVNRPHHKSARTYQKRRQRVQYTRKR